MASEMLPLPGALLVLLVLGMPVAAVAWTVTHEEIFREPREYWLQRSQHASSMLTRKLFYMLTWEYCFSHWVALVMIAITNFRLVHDDWRGYVIAGFALVWVANHYMSLFGRLRLGIKSERIDVSLKEELRDKVSNA